jgi:hypothetical protein
MGGCCPSMIAEFFFHRNRRCVRFIEQFAISFCSLFFQLNYLPVRDVSYWGWQQPLVEASNSFLNSQPDDRLWFSGGAIWKQAIEQPDTRLSLALFSPYKFNTLSWYLEKSSQQLHSNLYFVSSKLHAGQWRTPFTMARLDSGILATIAEHGATRLYEKNKSYVSPADERVAQGRTSRHMAWALSTNSYTCFGPSDRVIRKKKAIGEADLD